MKSKAGKNWRFRIGLGMLVVFGLVLVAMFLPLAGGQSGLSYLDNLFNSISKGSAYYLPRLKHEAQGYKGKNIQVSLEFSSAKERDRARLLFQGAGAVARPQEKRLEVIGDLGRIILSCLADADAMYHNQGSVLVARYQGNAERLMFYTWWVALNAVIKDLNQQKAFAQAAFLTTVRKKAVEMAYNYYKIEPASIHGMWPVVALALLFYVLYTLWYGYGVMYLFAGAGFGLDH